MNSISSSTSANEKKKPTTALTKRTTEPAKSVLKAPTKITKTTVVPKTTPLVKTATKTPLGTPLVKSKSTESTPKVLKVEVSAGARTKVTVKTVASKTIATPKKPLDNLVKQKSTPVVKPKVETKALDVKRTLKVSTSTRSKVLAPKSLVSFSEEILSRVVRHLGKEDKVALRTTCRSLQKIVDHLLIVVAKVQGIQLNEAMIANPQALEVEIRRILKAFPNTRGFDFTHWTVNMLLHDDMLKFLPVDLEYLNLAGCRKISDSSFPLMPRNLLYLNLTNCFHVSDEGLKSLPTSLVRLNLTNCFKITDEGIKHVPPNLRYLDVTRCFKVKNPWKSKHEMERDQRRQMKRYLETAKRKKAKENLEMRKLARDIEKEEARLREEELAEKRQKEEDLRRAKEEEEARLKEEEEQRILKAQVERKIKMEEERKRKEEEEAKLDEEMRRLEQEILEEEARLKEEDDKEPDTTQEEDTEAPTTPQVSSSQEIESSRSCGKESPTSGGSLDRSDEVVVQIQNLRKSTSIDDALLMQSLFAAKNEEAKESTERPQNPDDNILQQLQALLHRNDRKRSKSASAIRVKKNGRVKGNLSLDLFQDPDSPALRLTSSKSQPILVEERAKDQLYLKSLKSLIEESDMSTTEFTSMSTMEDLSQSIGSLPSAIQAAADMPVPDVTVASPEKPRKKKDTEKKSPLLSPKRLSVSDVASMASQKRQQRKMQHMRARAILKDLREEHLNVQSSDSEQSDQGAVQQQGSPGGEKRVRAWKLRMDFYKNLSVAEESPDEKSGISNEAGVPVEPDTNQQMAEILSKLDSLKGQLRSKHSMTKLNSKNSLPLNS